MAQNHDTVQDPAGLLLTRRAFASALAAPFLVSGTALAATVCQPGSLGPFCTSQIDFAAAYDADARLFNMSNAWLVNELDQNRPGARGLSQHEMLPVYMGGGLRFAASVQVS